MTVPALQKLIAALDTVVSGPPEALAHGVTAALESAISEPEWLPADRRRASHDN